MQIALGQARSSASPETTSIVMFSPEAATALAMVSKLAGLGIAVAVCVW
jgi:hypothetical protein